MANMSYCRFHNTRGDLSDCLDTIKCGEPMSDSEIAAGKRMFKEFLTFCRDRDILADFDGEAVDQLFDELREGE